MRIVNIFIDESELFYDLDTGNFRQSCADNWHHHHFGQRQDSRGGVSSLIKWNFFQSVYQHFYYKLSTLCINWLDYRSSIYSCCLVIFIAIFHFIIKFHFIYKQIVDRSIDSLFYVRLRQKKNSSFKVNNKFLIAIHSDYTHTLSSIFVVIYMSKKCVDEWNLLLVY